MLHLDKMLFNLPHDKHEAKQIREALGSHPEIKFVSLVGLDIGGHDTDEKIPAELFLKDIEKYMSHGVQTDGSSVVLPKIAELNNAKVDIIPDPSVNWYVDYNYNYPDENGIPVGTLRIPSFLVHNDASDVGSRVILRDAVAAFKRNVQALLVQNPGVFAYLDIESADEIEELVLTCATELEFWVKTPDDKADREQLSTAQILKEQYWKRTIGPVRTALEKSLLLLDRYGFEIEMAHKEVGGVKAKMDNSGRYDHVMEQLEVDWKFSTALQAADNENQVKYIIRDVFTLFGLDVSFMAKPIDGVAGNGEHAHMGLAAKLKNGKRVNLFAPKRGAKDFLSPIGYGAVMGLLKNYEVVNPFISSSNDALNRLKPGYEAPVCAVTSLGLSAEMPSRNRTVLVGLVRDINEPLATRFELRSPNPKSNTYLVFAASYMAMLDGIRYALQSGKTPEQLLAALSKKYGEPDDYLEQDREYRSEKDVFEDYTQEERDRLFGWEPATVWENIKSFERCPQKLAIFTADNVMDEVTLASFKEATVAAWATELHNRIIPNTMALVRDCRKLHSRDACADLDEMLWKEISDLRVYLGQDSIRTKCLLTRIKEALDSSAYDDASDMQKEMQGKVDELVSKYMRYKKNLL